MFQPTKEWVSKVNLNLLLLLLLLLFFIFLFLFLQFLVDTELCKYN